MRLFFICLNVKILLKCFKYFFCSNCRYIFASSNNNN